MRGPHLGSPHLPGFVQEGAVVDLRPRDLAQEVRFQNVRPLLFQNLVKIGWLKLSARTKSFVSQQNGGVGHGNRIHRCR